MKATDKSLEQMTNAELREFINGCHAAHDDPAHLAYDAWFRAATRILNDRS